MGTFLDTDVPDLFKANFRVIGGKTGWGATRVSFGGYRAAAVAMRKPDLSSYAAPIDGYFFHIDSNLAAGKTTAANATRPFALATSSPPPITMHAW